MGTSPLTSSTEVKPILNMSKNSQYNRMDSRGTLEHCISWSFLGTWKTKLYWINTLKNICQKPTIVKTFPNKTDGTVSTALHLGHESCIHNDIYVYIGQYTIICTPPFLKEKSMYVFKFVLICGHCLNWTLYLFKVALPVWKYNGSTSCHSDSFNYSLSTSFFRKRKMSRGAYLENTSKDKDIISKMLAQT